MWVGVCGGGGGEENVKREGGSANNMFRENERERERVSEREERERERERERGNENVSCMAAMDLHAISTERNVFYAVVGCLSGTASQMSDTDFGENHERSV